MSGFASGKNAWGISDRSGRRYRLKDMRREWNGLLVGPDEFEVKQPQLELRQNVTDPQALKNPRPDRAEPVSVYAGVPSLPGAPFIPLLMTTRIGDATPVVEVIDMYQKISTTTLAADARTIDIDDLTGYDEYLLRLRADLGSLWTVSVKTSSDGGSNFDGGASDYSYQVLIARGGSVNSGRDNAAPSVPLNVVNSGSTPCTFFADIVIVPSQGAVRASIGSSTTSTTEENIDGSVHGFRRGGSAINALQLDSGLTDNFLTGTVVEVYGLV